MKRKKKLNRFVVNSFASYTYLLVLLLTIICIFVDCNCESSNKTCQYKIACATYVQYLLKQFIPTYVHVPKSLFLSCTCVIAAWSGIIIRTQCSNYWETTREKINSTEEGNCWTGEIFFFFDRKSVDQCRTRWLCAKTLFIPQSKIENI